MPDARTDPTVRRCDRRPGLPVARQPLQNRRLDRVYEQQGGAGTDAGVTIIPFQTQIFKININLFNGTGDVAYCVFTY